MRVGCLPPNLGDNRPVGPKSSRERWWLTPDASHLGDPKEGAAQVDGGVSLSGGGQMESWMGGSATEGRGEEDLELLALPALQTLDGGGAALGWDPA